MQLSTRRFAIFLISPSDDTRIDYMYLQHQIAGRGARFTLH